MYRTGIRLQKTSNVFCKAGIFAILTYTFNEGLRFGRGIDYNIYWDLYELMEQGFEYADNIGFYVWKKLLINFSVPWQGCAMSMSLFFIIASLIFLKTYREFLPVALPLWIFLNRNIANNLMRWYFAFSFILIGLYFLIREGGKIDLKYIVFSFLGITIHYGILPIPIIFYWLYHRNKPIMSPSIAIIVFFMTSFLFQTKYMLTFIDVFTSFTELTDKFSGYGEDASYWLTKSAGGMHNHSWLGILDTFLGLFVTIVAYNSVRKDSKKNLFLYNVFLIGFVLRPAAIQVELLLRYDELFFCFKTLIFSYVFYIYKKHWFVKNVKIIAIMIYICFFLCFLNGTKEVYREREFKLLYVWDKGTHTPESMLDLYRNERFNTKTDN
jgi:hypothetical protein